MPIRHISPRFRSRHLFLMSVRTTPNCAAPCPGAGSALRRHLPSRRANSCCGRPRGFDPWGHADGAALSWRFHASSNGRPPGGASVQGWRGRNRLARKNPLGSSGAATAQGDAGQKKDSKNRDVTHDSTPQLTLGKLDHRARKSSLVSCRPSVARSFERKPAC